MDNARLAIRQFALRSIYPIQAGAKYSRLTALALALLRSLFMRVTRAVYWLKIEKTTILKRCFGLSHARHERGTRPQYCSRFHQSVEPPGGGADCFSLGTPLSDLRRKPIERSVAGPRGNDH